MFIRKKKVIMTAFCKKICKMLKKANTPYQTDSETPNNDYEGMEIENVSFSKCVDSIPTDILCRIIIRTYDKGKKIVTITISNFFKIQKRSLAYLDKIDELNRRSKLFMFKVGDSEDNENVIITYNYIAEKKNGNQNLNVFLSYGYKECKVAYDMLMEVKSEEGKL